MSKTEEFFSKERDVRSGEFPEEGPRRSEVLWNRPGIPVTYAESLDRWAQTHPRLKRQKWPAEAPDSPRSRFRPSLYGPETTRTLASAISEYYGGTPMMLI